LLPQALDRVFTMAAGVDGLITAIARFQRFAGIAPVIDLFKKNLVVG
jgi:hypothetical protein